MVVVFVAACAGVLPAVAANTPPAVYINNARETFNSWVRFDGKSVLAEARELYLDISGATLTITYYPGDGLVESRTTTLFYKRDFDLASNRYWLDSQVEIIALEEGPGNTNSIPVRREPRYFAPDMVGKREIVLGGDRDTLDSGVWWCVDNKAGSVPWKVSARGHTGDPVLLFGSFDVITREGKSFYFSPSPAEFCKGNGLKYKPWYHFDDIVSVGPVIHLNQRLIDSFGEGGDGKGDWRGIILFPRMTLGK